MRKWFLAVTVIVLIGLAIFISNKISHTEVPMQKIIEKNTFSLSSPAFANGTTIPAKFSCIGDNINPPLIVKGVPSQAKSLVLIMHDPDAPGGDFTHWLVWNINPQIAAIKENSVPNGSIQGTTGFGETKYGGPCPPSGIHHYIFDLYALDNSLGPSNVADKETLLKVMQGHILNQTSLTGLFGE